MTVIKSSSLSPGNLEVGAGAGREVEETGVGAGPRVAETGAGPEMEETSRIIDRVTTGLETDPETSLTEDLETDLVEGRPRAMRKTPERSLSGTEGTKLQYQVGLLMKMKCLSLQRNMTRFLLMMMISLQITVRDNNS